MSQQGQPNPYDGFSQMFSGYVTVSVNFGNQVSRGIMSAFQFNQFPSSPGIPSQPTVPASQPIFSAPQPVPPVAQSVPPVAQPMVPASQLVQPTPPNDLFVFGKRERKQPNRFVPQVDAKTSIKKKRSSKKSKKNTKIVRGIGNPKIGDGTKLQGLNEVIVFLGTKVLNWMTRASHDALIAAGSMGRTSGEGLWSYQPLPDKNIRKIIEIGGNPEKQGELVYGKKTNQPCWMTIIETIYVKNSESVRVHEVEHAVPAGHKGSWAGSCPGIVSDNRLKAAAGDHVYKFRQLEQIYLQLIIPLIYGNQPQPPPGYYDAWVRETCMKSTLLSRLLDIIFILPSIKSANQAKCSLKLLKLVLTRGSAVYGGYPVPSLQVDEGIADKMAGEMVYGTPPSGDYVPPAGYPSPPAGGPFYTFNSGRCGSKTFHHPDSGYTMHGGQVAQVYGNPPKLFTSTNNETLKNEIKTEIIKNARIVANFYNRIDPTDRQIAMAHTLISSLTNYTLILKDLYNNYEPNFNMPLVPLTRESIIFLQKYHGSPRPGGLLRDVNFNPREAIEIICEFARNPFVTEDMFRNNLEYYRSPVIRGSTSYPVHNSVMVEPPEIITDIQEKLDAQQGSKKKRRLAGGILPEIDSDPVPIPDEPNQDGTSLDTKILSNPVSNPVPNPEPVRVSVPEPTPAPIPEPISGPKPDTERDLILSLEEFKSFIDEISKLSEINERCFMAIMSGDYIYKEKLTEKKKSIEKPKKKPIEKPKKKPIEKPKNKLKSMKLSGKKKKLKKTFRKKQRKIKKKTERKKLKNKIVIDISDFRKFIS